MSGDNQAVEAGAIRQAASVYLKNFVEKQWETYDDSVPSLIPVADKAVLRGAIVEAVVGASGPVRVQLLTVVRRLVRSDFPGTWSAALDQIVPLLQSGDVNRISAGLGCFLELVCWRGGKETKGVTEAIQSQVFPILLQLAQQFIGHVGEEPAAQAIMKTILKCYFTAIQFRFSSWLLSGDAFMSWSQLSLAVIQTAVPAAVMALEREDVKENGYWKMKKWAFHIQNKLMSRYGNSKLDTYAGSEQPDFARAYMSQMAVPVLQVYLSQAHAAAEGRNPLPDRIVCVMCDFFENCFPAKKTWEAIKPQASWLVQAFVFPRLCWSATDAELWEEDPHEFIRTRLDPFDDFYSPAASCINMVVALVKQRKKDTFMPILAFVNGMLQDSHTTAEQKDGALFLVGSLASLLLDSKKMRSQMEPFLAAFVIPELRSPAVHLRLRACWVIEQFDELEYAVPANATSALSGILACMGEAGEEFPVRVAACTALAAILENPVVAQSVTPYLPRIVETILGLANEIELDNLSYVLEYIVSQFAEEMAPWAAQLCAQLRDTLMRSIDSYDPSQTNLEEGETPGLFDDTDKMMSVLGMLGTITTLVDSMSGKPETMCQLEAILLPLLHTVLSRRLMDVYEETFSLLDSLTYGQKAITPGMWALLESIHLVFLDAGSNYIPDMATSLDNYISYGAAELVRNPEALGRIVDIIRLTLTGEDFVESDWVHGCNLIEALFLNCRGAIDHLVGPLIQLVLGKLVSPGKKLGEARSQDEEPGVHALSHRVQHLESILAALYYNPLLTVQELERLQSTPLFLSHLVELAGERFTRVHDKKMLILAVSSLITAMPMEQMPAAWHQHWPSLLASHLEAISTLPKAIETRRKLKEEAERTDAEDDGEDDDGTFRTSRKHLDSDAEDLNDDEDAEEALHHAKTALGSDFESDDWPSDDESDWEDADELEEELYFETPLDQVDAPAVAAASIRALAHGQPQVFQQLASSLAPAHQATLQSLLLQ